MACDGQMSVPLVRWLGLMGSFSSRKDAAAAIKQERVLINGATVTSLATPVNPSDEVCLDEKKIVFVSSTSSSATCALPEHVHIMLHKPAGSLTGKNAKRQVGNGRLVDDSRPSDPASLISFFLKSPMKRSANTYPGQSPLDGWTWIQLDCFC
uniref:RNA-binding S4 domain-containing protein n=1 Tax=Grammatophora oceanica TaxID=210454 RepID=A0A7S1YG37_9STRA|mmetsp:Transcript_44670/g.66302  ORF Transcript_44670/g.66302 Transcript_44670/m.66302 type:complete len:153 (+) Transcript_44670:156-614(+)